MKNYESTLIRNWRIVFAKQGMELFWNRFVPGMHFNHCELVGRDDFGWCLIRPINAAVQVRMLGASVHSYPENWMEQDEDVCVLVPKRFAAKRPRVICFAPWTCVEVCKAHLNISCWWITTPDQLHDYIKAKGKPGLKWKLKNIVLSAMLTGIMLLLTPLVQINRWLK